jgi:cell wall assembly regulator SMI1
MNEVKWKYLERPVSEQEIRKVEEELNVTFPADYKQCVQVNHGASPEQFVLDVEGIERAFGSLLMVNTPESASDIVRTYESYKDTLPKDIIPFADDPGGNLVCFDYKDHKGNPIIVFWEHEEACEKEILMEEENLTEEEAEQVARENIFYVADTFTELLQKLRKYEEN